MPLKRSPVRRKRPGKPRRGPVGIPAEQWRNPAYLKFLRHSACVACYPALKDQTVNFLFAGCDPAHGPTNGTSSKGPDAEAIPLCRKHHDYQHEIGWPAFEAEYGIDRRVIAAAWWKAFRAQ